MVPEALSTAPVNPPFDVSAGITAEDAKAAPPSVSLLKTEAVVPPEVPLIGVDVKLSLTALIAPLATVT